MFGALIWATAAGVAFLALFAMSLLAGRYGYPSGEPLYNAAAAPEPVAAPPAAVAAPIAPGPAGADFDLIQFNNARCEVWQNSADNPPRGTDWARLAVGILDRDLAEAAYHSARAPKESPLKTDIAKPVAACDGRQRLRSVGILSPH